MIRILAIIVSLRSQSAFASFNCSTQSEIRIWASRDEGNRFSNLAVNDRENDGQTMIRGKDWVGSQAGLLGWDLTGVVYYCYNATLPVEVTFVNSEMTIDLATKVPTTSNTTATVSPRRCVQCLTASAQSPGMARVSRLHASQILITTLISSSTTMI